MIATGFEPEQETPPAPTRVVRANFAGRTAAVPVGRVAAVAEPAPFSRPPERPVRRHHLGDLDIPTFIRRQMD